ncbi:unnamed protein product [Dovyalis caffra]|uniref:Uncharacterized protein n=1 Tax=Dovyalis caffra TaxID=77055 RepID=A0AAV1SDC9_9ROSI|nr:unnamed protein product [Dovyalis caffra]
MGPWLEALEHVEWAKLVSPHAQPAATLVRFGGLDYKFAAARNNLNGLSRFQINVQEISNQQLETVPPLFIRDDVCGVINTVPSGNSLPVPLIDMSKLANPEFQEIELQKLHSACKD